ncbi:energy transducer TonB [Sphingomonas sp. HDW15A]|uniref:energy transducer TonB family protein n=1 Tax=Sphingomonas sp. HDW15A TaxID=2714942 RepID=UPI00140E8183|nr:energy transducer TonB [Sphingomonas sp. HDW15A]QIK95173.1 energy transducer TonB [Sphingomonas sp. HDW15A]
MAGRISNRDYRAIAGRDIEQGTAVFTLLVDTNGRVARCRTATSSGSARIDSTLCDMLTRRLRFRPAREADGTLLYQDVNYVARWGR